MPLQADGVDRRALLKQFKNEVAEGRAFGRRFFNGEFHIIFVENKLRLRIDRMGNIEGLLDGVRPRPVIPGIAPRAHIARHVGDRLVDHVPAMDHVLVTLHHLDDVGLHQFLDLAAAADTCKPGCVGGVPDQRMAVHGKLVLTRKVGDCIGGGEIEHVSGRPHDLPFHFGNGGDARAIFDNSRANAAIGIKIRQIDRGAIRGGFDRRLLLRGKGRAGHGMQQAGTCRTAQKIPSPDPHLPASATLAHQCPTGRNRALILKT